jgi:hypothetical protein
VYKCIYSRALVNTLADVVVDALIALDVHVCTHSSVQFPHVYIHIYLCIYKDTYKQVVVDGGRSGVVMAVAADAVGIVGVVMVVWCLPRCLHRSVHSVWRCVFLLFSVIKVSRVHTAATHCSTSA